MFINGDSCATISVKKYCECGFGCILEQYCHHPFWVCIVTVALLGYHGYSFMQEKGNQYVKLGKKHYADAIDCYTKAINQKALSDPENSVIYANRAHVNLLLGNYRRALMDAQEAIKLCPTNVKVCIVCCSVS